MKPLPLVLTVTVSCLADLSAPPAPRVRPLAITSVTVVDVSAATQDAALRTGQTVIVRDGHITAVNSDAAAVPSDVERMDGTGKYLIPGLWDMHAHVLSGEKRDSFLPLYIVNGVTSVRDMHTNMPMPEIDRWRQEIAAGRLIGPRLAAVAGPSIAGRGSRNTQSQVSTEVEARHAVVARKQSGVDFVKVGSNLPRPLFLAVADESRRQGLMLVGHVSGSSLTDALQAGQHGIEHASRLLEAASSNEAELTAERLEIQQTREPFMLRALRLATRARRTHSESKLKALSDLFRSRGAWLVPTLVQGYAWPYVQGRALPYQEWLAYMPEAFTRTWVDGNTQFGNPSEADFADAQANLGKTIEIVGSMHRAGVNILAGTDANGTFIGLIPGISLHYELVLLVQAGLTPLEALRTATASPAKFLKLESATGTIAPGKAADLVLLEANPLEDINNTRSIAAVIAAGRLYDRAFLDGLLTTLASTARK